MPPSKSAEKTDFGLDYDPYKAWLDVTEESRPLNAYQILNLKPLEPDAARIQASIRRQRALIEARRESAPPEAWAQVNDELEEAIKQLQDIDLKMVLDATLRRKMGLSGKKKSGAAAAVAPGLVAEIECRECGVGNSSARRFCSECGKPLYDVCPKCSVEVTVAEKFCGQCGANLAEVSKEKEEQVEIKLQHARKLQHEYKFEQAIMVLRSVAVIEDAKQAHLAEKANDLLRRFANERQEHEERAQRRLKKAKQHLEAFAYENALEKLEDIPKPLRSPEILAVYNEAKSKRDELLSLGGEIRESMEANRKHEILPKIERLLALKPDHKQANDLGMKLRDEITTAAKKRLNKNNYEEARSLLETIPTFAKNDEVESLLDKAMEMESLATDIRLSPVIDSVTIGLARKVSKMAEGNEEIEKLAADIEAKSNAKPEDPRFAAPPWAEPPRRTLLGLPVDWLGTPTRVTFANPEIEKEWRAATGLLHTAFGLALQAIDKASFDVEMKGEAKASFLPNISFGKGKVKSAWGIDLSASGLKAVKLNGEVKDGKPTVEAVAILKHAFDSGDVNKKALLEQTLKEFKAKHDVGKDQVVIGVPGQRCLGRFFDLPPIPAKKLKEAIIFEAKHQIPISLSDLHWAHRVIKQAEGKAADDNPRRVMVVAARDFHVSEKLELFKLVGIPVQAVTSDCLAIHNALHHEFFDEEKESISIATVDVGCDSSNVVISSKDACWFRSFGESGHDFTSALIKAFQLTTEQAEELKYEPFRAQKFHMLYSEFQPIFIQIGSEIEKSISNYQKSNAETPVRHVYGIGGAFGTHGLLRYLVTGR